MTKEYVAGFLFDPLFRHVVLVRKNKPEWQKGKLNGVGGKVEIDESIFAAIRREFNEEAGVDITNWKHFCMLSGNGEFDPEWRVHFFYDIVPYADLQDVRTVTDEAIIVADNEWEPSWVSNIEWLMAMAKAHHRYGVGAPVLRVGEGWVQGT